MTASNEQREDCWNQAIYAFGTAYLFEDRLAKTRRKLRVLTFLGLALPVTVGGIVVAFFGVESLRPFLSLLILFAGILGTIQLVFTLWALVAKWEETAAYSAASTSENRRLAARFEELGKMPPTDFEVQYQVLKADNTRRQETDIQQGINESEKRMITRAGLRQYQRECVKCHIVPRDMISTDCPVCGNF